MSPLYFGVLTNREFIKLRGVRRPFWEFLERQPDGWLTSLTYQKAAVPIPDARGPMIYDCGAWSYRAEEVPKLGPVFVTPEWALETYLEKTRPGDFVVCPDHMLVDGVDHAARRAWNLDSARRFVALDAKGRVPMAVIHGQTLDERLDHARLLVSLGYGALALGGMAARAAQKTQALAIAAAVREETRGRWLHVLGLSSPDYARNWKRIGIDSFDGSSHFKQAFTAGAYFAQDGAKLTKWQAARPGESISAPECDCVTCVTLRADGTETRSYGSNETNMGRAAHNMNMLMRAQRVAMRRRIVLVACAGEKTPGPAPAADLYRSPLFLKSRAWAERNGDAWFILSAKHGLVAPGTVLDPYDLSLNSMTAAAKGEWAQRVASQMAPYRDEQFVVLAGKDYCRFAEVLGVELENPLAGLGIGQRLAWLTEQNAPPTNPQRDLFERELTA